MNPNQVCSVHNQPWKTVPGGISKKTGRPYNAFLACPQQGCPEKPPKETGPAGDFSRSLDNAASNIDEKKKGEAMGRNNIAHAMIRAGFLPTFENLTAAETWFHWSRGAMPLIVANKTPTPTKQEYTNGTQKFGIDINANPEYPGYNVDENPLG